MTQAVDMQVPAEIRKQLAFIDDQHARYAREDPNAFMTYVLRHEETGKPILQSRLHMAWQKRLNEHKRVLLWSHVEAGKTNQVSIGRVMWEIGRNPNLRVVVVSNTGGQSTRICMTIQRYMSESAEYRKVFPKIALDKKQPMTQAQFTVKRDSPAKDPTLRVTGVHGNILGARIDLLVLDDLLDYENTLTQHGRDDLYNWYQSTLEGRLTREARIWFVGTAWHRDDMMHRFAKNRAWCATRYPIVDTKSQPTWPEQWPATRIEAKRNVIGPMEFSRQFLCVARSDEDARFKQEWIDACTRRGNGLRLLDKLATVPPGCRTYTGVDLGTGRDRDLTVLFTIMVHPNGDRQVIDIESGNWHGDAIVEKIIDKHDRYKSIVIVEDNASQKFILDFARRTSSVPVKPYTTTGKTFRSQEFGLESMAVEIANAKWIIPNLNGQLSADLRAWVTELLYYDPNSHPGDRLMASWFAREGASRANPMVEALRRQAAWQAKR